MSGRLTHVDGIDDQMLVGDEIWFHVVDNGEGRNAQADQISLVLVELEPVPKPIFCDTPLSEIPADVLEAANLQDILSGNIQINP